jgi:hypothetical protein
MFLDREPVVQIDRTQLFQAVVGADEDLGGHIPD